MILTNVTIAPMGSGAGLLEDAALRLEGDRIAWVGPVSGLDGQGGEHIDLGGRLVTPGLVDCHTHLVHAGDRARAG